MTHTAATERERIYRAEMLALANELAQTTDPRQQAQICKQAKALTRAHLASTEPLNERRVGAHNERQ